MAAELYFAVPGDLDSKTGGYVYDSRLIAELRRLHWTVRHLRWPDTFPFPDANARQEAAGSLAACPDGSLVLIDGLGFGVLPELLARESQRLRLVALVHHPLALETGLSPEESGRLAAAERAALAAAEAIVVTSARTARTLTADFGVPADRITVAPPGVDYSDFTTEPRPPGTAPHLLTIATVTPRKAHDVLIAALSLIADLDWRCTIAGSLDRAPDTASAVLDRVEVEGLSRRILFAGEIADPTPLYRSADIFVLPSRYEGYGMVFAEALSHGLPIVATEAGAIPDLVPPSAGILVPVDDAPRLAAALRLLITDPAARARLAAGARAAAASLPRWEDTASRVAELLLRLRADGPPR